MFAHQFLMISRFGTYTPRPRTLRIRRLIQTLSVDPAQLICSHSSSFDGGRPQPSFNCWKRPR